EIGFIWFPYNDDWNRGYEFLIKYKEENGDCRVPKRYKYDDFKLGSWVSEQRKKNQRMSKERREKLDKIGFIWDARKKK
ncbi:MAG: helicase associated domain-containing protein, partial [Bacteroidota bacterium]